MNWKLNRKTVCVQTKTIKDIASFLLFSCRCWTKWFFLFCFWSQWLTRNTIISFLYRNELKSRHQKRISLLCARWNWTSCPLPIMASYRQLYRGTVPLYLSLLQEFLPIFQATRPSMKTTDAADDKIFSQVWNNKLIPLSLIVKDYWYSTVPTWIRIYTRAT
jgi:hypothetical protein